VLFALGLMSKPMLVTLPFVLLLLDFWPLRRLLPNLAASAVSSSKFKVQGSRFKVERSAFKAQAAGFLRLPIIREKIPFVCLAAISSIITLLVQVHGHANYLELPFSRRVSNAVVS